MTRRDRETAAWFARMRGPDAEAHRAAFEDWRRDPENAAAYADAYEAWHRSGDVERANLAGLRKAPTTPRPASLRWAMGAAAVLALAFAWYLQASPRTTGLAGEEAMVSAIHLADGSEVVPMDGARIATRFSATRRHVTLTGGRARFTVAHDADRPFTVVAGNMETTALGTIFEIDLRQAHPRVDLIQGAVEVRASGGANAVRLAAGESAEVEGEHARRVPDKADPAAANTLDIDSLPLNAVIDRANGINAVPIRLADPALGTLAVTGRFDVSDSGALARKLAFALDLDLTSGPDGHMLSAKQEKPQA